MVWTLVKTGRTLDTTLNYGPKGRRQKNDSRDAEWVFEVAIGVNAQILE